MQYKKQVEKITIFLTQLLNKVKMALFDKKRCYFILFVLIYVLSLFHNNKANNKPLKFTIMKASEIKSANPQGTFSMDYSNEVHSVVFSNGVRFNCESLKEATKLYKKLEKMGYTRSFNFDSDEFDGLCEANKLGLEFPKATCICLNPEYNF